MALIDLGILDLFEKVIVEHGSSVVQRRHLALLRTQIGQLETECAELKERLAEVEQENRRMRAELAEHAASDEFVKHRGAYFKPKSSGGYDPTVYCVNCRLPMSSCEGVAPYTCRRCHVSVDFFHRDLPSILEELEKENT